MSFTSNKIAVLQFETQLSYTCLYLNASFFRNSGSSSNEYDNPESAITRRLLLIDTSMLKTFLAHFSACLNLYSSLASSLGKSCTKKACLKCSVSFIFSFCFQTKSRSLRHTNLAIMCLGCFPLRLRAGWLSAPRSTLWTP